MPQNMAILLSNCAHARDSLTDVFNGIILLELCFERIVKSATFEIEELNFELGE